VETILQDLRYAVRTLARQPAFTAIAVFTLAVGIGANTAIYSVVDATLLRTLPFSDPGRLMKLVARNAKKGAQFTPQGVLRFPLAGTKPPEVFQEVHALLEQLALEPVTA